MKIRSLGELVDYLGRDLGWRRRELTTIRLRISRDRSHQRIASLRSGVCLLYAHWEGFVRKAGQAYIRFVNSRGLRMADLSEGLLTLALRGRISRCEQSKKISVRMELVSFLLSDMSEDARLPLSNAIATRANLNTQQFREILDMLGLDPAEYLKKTGLIDGRLIRWRNGIAHGDRIDVEEQDYVALHDGVIMLLDRFRTDLENAAVTGAFRRRLLRR